MHQNGIVLMARHNHSLSQPERYEAQVSRYTIA
jgi:hypothetical protein